MYGDSETTERTSKCQNDSVSPVAEHGEVVSYLGA